MGMQSGGKAGGEMRGETVDEPGYGSGGEPEGKPGDEPEGKPGGESVCKLGDKSGVGSVGESGGETEGTLEGKAAQSLLPVDSGLEAGGQSLLLESNFALVLGENGLAAGVVLDHGVETGVCAAPDLGLWLGFDVGSEIGSELAR